MSVVYYVVIFIGLFWLLGAHGAEAAGNNDLNVTIEVVEDSDQIDEMINTLSLPENASDRARDRAESRDGYGLSKANDMRRRNELSKQEHREEIAERKERHENAEQRPGNAYGIDRNRSDQGMGGGQGQNK